MFGTNVQYVADLKYQLCRLVCRNYPSVRYRYARARLRQSARTKLIEGGIRSEPATS